MVCCRRHTIPSWGGLHARWGPTEALPDQPKKMRVSNPARFPMCMLATVGPPPKVRALPQLSWGLVAGSLTAVGPPPKVGALPQLSWGLVAGSLTACTFSRVE